MPSQLTPDLCIIGDHAGGLRAALLAAAFGVPTILVRTGASDERRAMDLSTWAAASHLAHRIRHASDFGLQTDRVTFDLSALSKRLDAHRQIIETRFSNARLAALGIRVIDAPPQFESTQILRAGDDHIAARRFILALDDEPLSEAPDEAKSSFVLTPETLDRLSVLPQTLTIIGGKADALVYAQSFVRLGVKTTLIAPDGLLPDEDAEQVALIAAALRREGVTLHTHRPVTIEPNGDGARIIVAASPQGLSDGVEQTQVVLDSRRTLLGLDRLGLARAGIASGPEGIKVDAQLRTSNRAVFAIGACAAIGQPGQGMAAARAQADLVMRHILFRLPVRYEPDRIPRACGTDPEFAAVGLTEAEARQRQGAISVLRSAMAENDLALAHGDRNGHAKILLDRRGRLLGASLTGPGARDLIGPWAAQMGQKPDSIRQTVPPSPSHAETPRRALMEAYAPLARSKMVRALSHFLRRIG